MPEILSPDHYTQSTYFEELGPKREADAMISQEQDFAVAGKTKNNDIVVLMAAGIDWAWSDPAVKCVTWSG